MGVFETYTKREKRRQNTEKQDVYQYDVLPGAFRVQVIHIWNSTIGAFYQSQGYGSGGSSPSNEFWLAIQDVMCRELGVFKLAEGLDPDDRCRNYLLAADTAGALDIIELSFRVIDFGIRKFDVHDQRQASITQDVDDAIEELNDRFREHGIGYQYIDGKIVRVDSQFLHAEAVKPALTLLHEAGFSGPADEFMRAFDHHRKGESKDAIADALSAFESTMKAICKARNWTYGPKDTAKPLMDILFSKGLVPPEMESHIAGLRSAMESGLPTLANRTSRHGQGPTPVEIPPHYAAYALHLVASNIVFLIECHKAKK